jgi:hypothetical protein
MLNRKTASPASAGNRQDIFRSRCDSMEPCSVVSGWTHTSVATGGTFNGTASSP